MFILRERSHGSSADSARREPKGRLTLWGHFTSLPTGKAILMLSLCRLPFVFREVALFDREQHGEEFDG